MRGATPRHSIPTGSNRSLNASFTGTRHFSTSCAPASAISRDDRGLFHRPDRAHLRTGKDCDRDRPGPGKAPRTRSRAMSAGRSERARVRASARSRMPRRGRDLATGSGLRFVLMGRRGRRRRRSPGARARPGPPNPFPFRTSPEPNRQAPARTSAHLRKALSPPSVTSADPAHPHASLPAPTSTGTRRLDVRDIDSSGVSGPPDGPTSDGGASGTRTNRPRSPRDTATRPVACQG